MNDDPQDPIYEDFWSDQIEDECIDELIQTDPDENSYNQAIDDELKQFEGTPAQPKKDDQMRNTITNFHSLNDDAQNP